MAKRWAGEASLLSCVLPAHRFFSLLSLSLSLSTLSLHPHVPVFTVETVIKDWHYVKLFLFGDRTKYPFFRCYTPIHTVPSTLVSIKQPTKQRRERAKERVRNLRMKEERERSRAWIFPRDRRERKRPDIESISGSSHSLFLSRVPLNHLLRLAFLWEEEVCVEKFLFARVARTRRRLTRKTLDSLVGEEYRKTSG